MTDNNGYPPFIDGGDLPRINVRESHLEDELPGMTAEEKITATVEEFDVSVADAYAELVKHGFLDEYSRFTRGYARRSGETSTGVSFASIDEAIADAVASVKSRGVHTAWVRGIDPESWELGDVLWSATKGPGSAIVYSAPLTV